MSPAAKENLQLLRRTLLGAGALLIVAAAAGAWAASRFNEHQRQIQAAEQAQAAALEARRTARSDAELLQQIGAQYQALRERGVIESGVSENDAESKDAPAKFSRTQALDRFESALRSEAAVERYALDKAQLLPDAGAANLQQLAVIKHSLLFEAAPLHEDEFLRIWQRAGDGAGGLRAIEQCSLQRTVDNSPANASASNVGQGDTNVPRLRARCTLNWYVFSTAADAAQLNAQAAPPQ